MRKLLILLFFFTGATHAQTVSQNQVAGYKGWKTLENPQYSIQYPPGWETNESGKMGTSFFIFSPADSEQDKFRENINLLIQDLTGKDIDLDKFTEISEGQINTMVANGKLIESERIKTGKNEYHKIIYYGDQSGMRLAFEQYYWVIKDHAYILTFSTERDKFTALQQTGEMMLNSFIIKK